MSDLTRRYTGSSLSVPERFGLASQCCSYSFSRSRARAYFLVCVLGALLFYWLFHTLMRKRSVFGDLGSVRSVGSAFDCAFGGGNFGRVVLPLGVVVLGFSFCRIGSYDDGYGGVFFSSLSLTHSFVEVQ